ncbi:hypothetical protein ACRALDRAFT_1067789 [Sodiomyces alcalophilus JCM 7366]|uniref:uncharacterized protein n=1 Tax=Sodiomyces alcalophilus JCM 7366 TaxID=591952 RepID=UPI0039B370B4
MGSSEHRNNRVHALRDYIDGFDLSFQGGAVAESTYYQLATGPSYDADNPRGTSAWSETSSVSSGPTVDSCATSVWTRDAGVGSNVPPQDTHRMPALYTPSEVPSTQPRGLDPFDQYLLDASRAVHGPDDPGPPSPFIPCEFSRFTGCTTTFPADELGLGQYIEHIASHHLRHSFPPRCSCWWCDDFVFDADHPTTGGDRRRNFANRMAHIRDHVSDTALAAAEGSNHVAALHRARRPDFWMLEHLWNERLIDARAFEAERSIREAPCPDGIYPAGWRPDVPERVTGVEDDLEGEERRRRRQERRQRGGRRGTLGVGQEVSGGF